MRYIRFFRICINRMYLDDNNNSERRGEWKGERGKENDRVRRKREKRNKEMHGRDRKGRGTMKSGKEDMKERFQA